MASVVIESLFHGDGPPLGMAPENAPHDGQGADAVDAGHFGVPSLPDAPGEVRELLPVRLAPALDEAASHIEGLSLDTTNLVYGTQEPGHGLGRKAQVRLGPVDGVQKVEGSDVAPGDGADEPAAEAQHGRRPVLGRARAAHL